MKKINKTIYARKHNVEQIPDDLIRFSFKYISFTKKYPLKEKDDNYF